MPVHRNEALHKSPANTHTDALVAKATAALNRIRQTRRQTPVRAEADKISSRNDESSTIRRIVDMLQSDRAYMALQPVVRTTGSGNGFCECLIRLEDSDGIVQPVGETVVLAERLGLSRTLDRLSLDLTMALLERFGELSLSVNVSALTCSDAEWLAALDGWLSEKPHLATRLIIEITETAMMPELDQSRAFVAALKARECRVALDDFGAGHSSFESLVNIGVDIVKIDGGFVRNVLNEPADQEFIAAMVDLARHLEIELVVEWVGDSETADLMVDLGADYLQGYYIGRPQNPDQILTAQSVLNEPDRQQE